MFWTQPEIREGQRADLAIVEDFLIGLEAFQRIDGVASPFAIYLALEIASIRERLLD